MGQTTGFSHLDAWVRVFGHGSLITMPSPQSEPAEWSMRIVLELAGSGIVVSLWRTQVNDYAASLMLNGFILPCNHDDSPLHHARFGDSFNEALLRAVYNDLPVDWRSRRRSS